MKLNALKVFSLPNGQNSTVLYKKILDGKRPSCNMVK